MRTSALANAIDNCFAPVADRRAPISVVNNTSRKPGGTAARQVVVFVVEARGLSHLPI